MVIGRSEGTNVKDVASSLNIDEEFAEYILGRLLRNGLVMQGNSYHLTEAGRTVLKKVEGYLPEVRRAIGSDVYFSLLNKIVG